VWEWSIFAVSVRCWDCWDGEMPDSLKASCWEYGGLELSTACHCGAGLLGVVKDVEMGWWVVG
jgi:hypothetical protein